jgi:hypothetical protein
MKGSSSYSMTSLALLLLAVWTWSGTTSSYAATQDTVFNVDTLWIVGGGDSAQWEGSSTPHWDMIDELSHDGDATYIQFDNTADHTWEFFDIGDWYPAGLTSIDSFKLIHTDRETDASANGSFSHVTWVRGNYYEYDTITPSGTSYTTTAGRKVTVDPYTTVSWLLEDFNDAAFGFHRTANTSGSGLYTRVTNAFVVVYWGQQVIYDTVSTKLLDAWMDQENNTWNYGGTTTLHIGDSDSYNKRAVFALDTTLIPFNASFALDTALLIYKVSALIGNTHTLQAYLTHRLFCAGTQTGTTQTDAVNWLEYRYSGTGTYLWQMQGADSTENAGGYDRTGVAMSSSTITATGWDTLNVTDWFKEAIYGTKFAGSSCQALSPALIVKRSSEGTDSSVRIYSRDYGTAADRPWIYTRQHNPGNTMGYTQTASGDSLNPTAVGGGTNWTNWSLSTINSSNDTRATYNNTTRDFAWVTGFGISTAPTGTLVVDSIFVGIEGNGAGNTVARRQYDIQLLKAGTGVGTELISTFNLNSDTRAWFAPADRKWGTTWTEADIEHSGFGIRVRDDNTGAHALNFDHIYIRVFFHDQTGGAKVITVGG